MYTVVPFFLKVFQSIRRSSCVHRCSKLPRYERCCSVSPGTTDSTCDTASWPDKEVVCGSCKVLVDRFESHYKTCDGYCTSIGRVCTGAWEESSDTCTVKYDMRCDQALSSSAAICECGEEGHPGRLLCGIMRVTSKSTTISGFRPKCYGDVARRDSEIHVGEWVEETSMLQ